MPIRLTTAYAERLAADRFDEGSQTRQDITSLCQFWKRLRDTEASNVKVLRDQILGLVQETRSASARLLNGSDPLIECSALKLHERFELAHLSAIIRSCIEAFEVILEEPDKTLKRTKKNDQAEDAAEREKLLAQRLDSLANIQTHFLIGTSPTNYVKEFFTEACSLALLILSTKGLKLDNTEIGAKYVKTATHCFEVWLSSDSAAATWVSDYLNFQHQSAVASRVLDEVTSIQQALQHWLQPTTEAAKKRADAWARYKASLTRLPDLKETMYAEQFGVRKVFVQPVARYKVAGMGPEIEIQVPDVGNLIAGLISERVPGDELILLCGGPGSGKSTLCRIIASELASNDQMHPVFLRLRRLQDAREIANSLETHLQREGVIDKFSDLAGVSNLVLILDGFDELVMATRTLLREFFNTLREDLVIGPLRNAKAIVSGRDTLFPNGVGLPTGSHVISLLPFDQARVKVWGEKWRSQHTTAPGNNFQPQVFYDGRADNPGFKAPPLHHLISWPLTLHLVARVHSAGALDITKAKQQTFEKAVLYRSIVCETALRQQDQSFGKGRLSPEQMRDFVQAIAWEMYSTSRDALEYTEGLPLLKSIHPGASEAELADLADVAIVNQPELTKGEERGFEFIHKSFSEYFVAETFARTIEKVSFKSQDYDSDKLTWRMSVKEALGELSSLIGIRVITSEVQEMLEPMLADFKEFNRPTSSSKSRGVGLIEKLRMKQARVEQLIVEYTSGNYHGDVVERVRDSKIVRNELEIHANFSVGLLVMGCALAKRVVNLRAAQGDHNDTLMVESNQLWRLISIIQAGEIQLDVGLAERCFSPLRIGSGEKPIEVAYPPIPPLLLHGVRGAVFTIENAVTDALKTIAMLLIEMIYIGSGIGASSAFDRHSPRSFLRPRRFRMISELSHIFRQVGVVSKQWDRDSRYVELVEELPHIIRMLEERGDGRGFEELRYMFHRLREFDMSGHFEYDFHKLMVRMEDEYSRRARGPAG